MNIYLESHPRNCMKNERLKRAVLETLLKGKTVHILCDSEAGARRTFNDFVEFFKVITNE